MTLNLKIYLTLLLAILFLRLEIHSQKGVVASAHPQATKAGVDILNKGGNAFDAAVAIASTLNVVEPMMSGIGGYGTILIYDATKKEIRYLNSSGRFPMNTNSDLMRPPTPEYMKNRSGAKAVSTPGNLHAWEGMHKLYGILSWKSLFESAIYYAENGFQVNKSLAAFIDMSYNEMPPQARSYYGINGEPLKQGDILFQKDLANTFKIIAEKGVEPFYEGELAMKIDIEMKKAKGFLRMADLKTDKTEWWEPVKLNYKGYDIYTASPPANSFAGLTFLGIMNEFGDKKFSHNSADYLHIVAEISKQSFYSRLKYSGNPFLDPPLFEKALSKDFFDSCANAINITRAKKFEYPFSSVESMNTTHFVVADKWGNIVSATQTLGGIFGSKIMPDGTGIWLNNSMAYCTFEPKGNPMDAKGGQYKFSGDCPIIIMKDGLPWAALGTPGGHTITQNIPQIIFNLIDYEMNVQEAINAPKISFAEPDILMVEAGIGNDIINNLKERGHKVEQRRIGNATGLQIRRSADGRIISLDGAADKRGDGSVEVQ